MTIGFTHVNPGYFRQSFPDLFAATQDRDRLDFATISSQLNAEAAKSDEGFEWFGLKFRSEQITRWGMAVLIGVQLYLFMYLKQLSNKLEPDDPGWDVPWIAMDQSLLARTLFFVSITLFAGVWQMWLTRTIDEVVLKHR